MNKIDTKKLLLFLLVLVLYVNYNNYFKEDNHKLSQRIETTKERTQRERDFSLNSKNDKEDNRSKDYGYLFVKANKESYAQSMGKFEKKIEKISKGFCEIASTRWKEMPLKKESWYDVLGLKISFHCTPQNFMKFQNRLRQEREIFYFNQFNIYKDRRRNYLTIATEVFTYRIKKDEK